MKICNKILLLLLYSALLAACGFKQSPAPLADALARLPREPNALAKALQANPGSLVTKAGQTKLQHQPQAPISYQLASIDTLLRSGARERATQLLQQLPANLPTEDQQIRMIFSAQLASGNPHKVLHLLAQIQDPNTLPATIQTRYHYLLAQAFTNDNRPLQSLREWLIISNGEPYLSEELQTQIWQALSKLSDSQLATSSVDSDDKNLTAWIELQQTVRSYQNKPKQLQAMLLQWKQRHPNHSGNALLHLNYKIPAKAPSRIVLLLPLTGKLAKPGTAIRDGFMAAFYQQHNKGTYIEIIDSNKGSIKQLYRQAAQYNPDLIVGPLSKQKLQQLAKHRLPKITTLALNTIPEKLPAQFIQFGLSPLDETNQIANRAWQDGHRRALVIVPKGSWGNQIAAQFQQDWQRLGGKIPANLHYDQNSSLKTSIRHLLTIDASQHRYRNLKKIVNAKTIRFIPRMRKDIDMIFMVAKPSQARAIRPLLKFYYAGKLPIYSTSMIYAGNPSPRRDRDFNQVIFTDMPWVFPGNQRTNYGKIKKIWPHNVNRYTRLYALGIDAYHLINQLPSLQLVPKLRIKGTTGTLSLGSDGRIHRSLNWATFKNGRIKPIG